MIKYNMAINNLEKRQVEKKMKTNLKSELVKIVDRIKPRVEKEIPDTGYFRDFAENFDKGYKPDIFCKNIALFVKRDEQRDGRAFLGIDVLHPTMNKHVYSYLMNGDRKKILDYISDEKFIKEFEDVVKDLSASLEK